MSAFDARAANGQLQLALDQWRQWQCEPALQRAPQLEAALPGGFSNHMFLVESGGRRFVLRVDGVPVARHGLNRHAEWQTLITACAAGIAPAPRYFNPELGVLVCDYLEPDADQSVNPAQLARLLRRIHALPARHHRLNLAERINHYRRQALREHGYELPAALDRAVGDLLDGGAAEAPTLLCHNDLLPANLLVSGGRLYALDWEYSAMGNPWFDIAGAALGQGLAPGEDGEFLTHYLGTAPDAAQCAEMQRQRALCRSIEMLWYVVEAGADTLPAVLEKHQPLLEAELP